jgi:hypothetical protein
MLEIYVGTKLKINIASGKKVLTAIDRLVADRDQRKGESNMKPVIGLAAFLFATFALARRRWEISHWSK